MSHNRYTESQAQKDASAFFNSLPFEYRSKLGPLLEWHRQAGMAEAMEHIDSVGRKLDDRIDGIRKQDTP